MNPEQLLFESTPISASQEDFIIDHLKQNLGTWISMPTLAAVSGSYNVHSRISGLRRKGYAIRHVNVYKSGTKAVNSFYLLEP